jgi:hypothetical protein
MKIHLRIPDSVATSSYPAYAEHKQPSQDYLRIIVHRYQKKAAENTKINQINPTKSINSSQTRLPSLNSLARRWPVPAAGSLLNIQSPAGSLLAPPGYVTQHVLNGIARSGRSSQFRFGFNQLSAPSNKHQPKRKLAFLFACPFARSLHG